MREQIREMKEQRIEQEGIAEQQKERIKKLQTQLEAKKDDFQIVSERSIFDDKEGKAQRLVTIHKCE